MEVHSSVAVVPAGHAVDLQAHGAGKADAMLKPARAMAEQQTRTLRAKAAFLRAFAKTGNVFRSAQHAGCGRRTVYEWLKEDEAFKQLYAEAHEDAIDLIEEEARRRGVEGMLEPVYQGGVKVGEIRRYSDALLALYLKGKRPEIFRERHEYTGKDGGPIAVRPILVSYDSNMKPPEEPDT